MERIELEIDSGRPQRRLKLGFETEASSARLDLNACVHLKQVHGRTILEAQPRKAGLLGEADGVVARGDWFLESPHPLVIKTADCIPLLMWDSRSLCAVAIHAGWRGLAQGIHRVPFEQGWCDPASTQIAIGPSLNGINFEVGADMWRQFPRQMNDDRFFKPTLKIDKRIFFAWDFVAVELAELGVRRGQMHNVGVDTFVETAFASYRRAKRAGGELAGARNLSWLGLVPPPLKS